MSIYRRFEQTDILYTVAHASPSVIATSGTSGWRGNVGVSSSISLYGGIRGRNDVYGGSTSGVSIYPLDPLDTNSIDKTIYVSGSYPATGSIQLIKCRLSASSHLGDVTSTDWYEEHFNPICRLYDYYSWKNADYTTCSFDYYSLFFNQIVPTTCSYISYQATASLGVLSSSFTLEAWIKPTSVSSSIGRFTIMAHRDRMKFFITGSTGRLCFSDFATTLTSSQAISTGSWQHVAVTVGGGSASFVINGVLVDSYTYTGSLIYNGVIESRGHIVGGEPVRPSSTTYIDFGFCGYMGDIRAWKVKRSVSQISSSMGQTLFDSGSADLAFYNRFNDGPLGESHGQLMGSGSFDYSRVANHGTLTRFDVVGTPGWQPNDNANFVTKKTIIPAHIEMMKVVHVPSMFYGRQIATGSVKIVDNSFSQLGIRRVIVDDGRGGLYISGSACRPLNQSDDYLGVRWNKVGNVFYNEGLIVITDPSMLTVGENILTNDLNDLFQISFRGENVIPTKVLMCRIPPGELNGSNNKTFSYADPVSQRQMISLPGGPTYITSIGIYNEERKLVAVARLAKPMRKREKDPLDIRIRLDY